MSDATLALDDASNVLVLASRVGSVGIDTCLDLLANTAEPLDRLFVVTVGETPTAWQQRLEATPVLAQTPVSYIDVKTLVRSTSADGDTTDLSSPVTTISSPADLGSLGTALTKLMSRADAENERVGLCLYSITDMLEFVDREFLFKFLFTIGARVRQSDAIAFYHLDNDAPDDELRTLFAHSSDTVVTLEDDSLTVSPGQFDIETEQSKS
jgi:hypothetical protein